MFPPFKLYTNPKACHCETVRTLSWQSVLLKNVNIPRHRDADRHTSDIGHLLRDDSNPALPTIITTTEVVVCMSPRRANYRQNPLRGIEIWLPHYLYRPPLKRPVFMPTYSCDP